MKNTLMFYGTLLVLSFFGIQVQGVGEILPSTFLFAHGMWGNKNNAEWYAPGSKNNWSIITGPYYTFNFPDVGSKKGELITTKVNIGQEADIKALLQEYTSILATPAFTQDPQEDIVLVGSSRGAVTIINTLGTHTLPRLRAVVAEAPADSVLHVLDYHLSKYGLNWQWMTSLSYYVLSKFYYTGHDRLGINPLKVVKNIPHDIPLMLVHSENDEFISPNSSRALYYELVSSGHPYVFLLELPDGKHGKYNLGKSAQMYEAAVHAFYKRFNVPYNETLAQEGEQYLMKSQPTLQEIKERLKKQAAYYLTEPKEEL